jgi:hypothetical protein
VIKPAVILTILKEDMSCGEREGGVAQQEEEKSRNLSHLSCLGYELTVRPSANVLNLPCNLFSWCLKTK